MGKLWSEYQVVVKRWPERPKRASRRKTVVGTAKSWKDGVMEHVHGHTWVTVGIGKKLAIPWTERSKREKT